MPFMRRMPDEYTVKDMKIPAQFMTSPDVPELKLLIKPITDVFDEARKTYVPKDGSGVRVVFRGGIYLCENSKIFSLLVGHRAFRKSHHGFDIDKTDPTGFWRACGLVEEKQVVVCKSVKFDVDLTKVNARLVAENLAKEIDPTAETETLAKIEELEARLADAEKEGDAQKAGGLKTSLTKARTRLEEIRNRKIEPLAELRY